MPRFGAKRKSKSDSEGIGSIILEKSVETKILTEISKSRIITATEIGKKYSLNIGMVRNLLKEQALKGIITPVFKIQGNQVYSSPAGLKALEADKEKIRQKNLPKTEIDPSSDESKTKSPKSEKKPKKSKTPKKAKKEPTSPDAPSKPEES